MKFLACVSLYNPTLEQIERINLYGKSFDQVVIYDNSLDNSYYKDKICQNYVYFFNNKNDGLCVCFNFALNYCQLNNFHWLCTLDQDSLFKECDIRKMKDDITLSDFHDVAIIAPKIIYNHNLNNNLFSSQFEQTNWVICSGAFLNVPLLLDNNIKYDEYYFLDRFDKDICEQIFRKGYGIIINHSASLYQDLGYTIKGKSCHNTLRHYYIFRNRFYYNNKFYQFPTKELRTLCQVIKHLSQIILNEDKKVEKLLQLKQGYLDFRRGK